MPIFRCRMRGENFPGSLADEQNPVGFYTTRYVEAPSATEAEIAALNALRSEPEFERVKPGDRTDDARVYFEQIDEVALDAEQGAGGGFSFFLMGT